MTLRKNDLLTQKETYAFHRSFDTHTQTCTHTHTHTYARAHTRQILRLIRGEEGTTCVLGLERTSRSETPHASYGDHEPPGAVIRCSVLRVATPHTVFREQRGGGGGEGSVVGETGHAVDATVSDKVRDRCVCVCLSFFLSVCLCLCLCR